MAWSARGGAIAGSARITEAEERRTAADGEPTEERLEAGRAELAAMIERARR